MRKAPQAAEVGIVWRVFGDANVWGLWPIVGAVEVAGGELSQEGSWLAVVKGNGQKGNGRRLSSNNPKLEPSSSCTITFSANKLIIVEIYYHSSSNSLQNFLPPPYQLLCIGCTFHCN